MNKIAAMSRYFKMTAKAGKQHTKELAKMSGPKTISLFKRPKTELGNNLNKGRVVRLAKRGKLPIKGVLNSGGPRKRSKFY